MQMSQSVASVDCVDAECIASLASVFVIVIADATPLLCAQQTNAVATAIAEHVTKA